jgi:hypothetical protein
MEVSVLSAEYLAGLATGHAVAEIAYNMTKFVMLCYALKRTNLAH